MASSPVDPTSVSTPLPRGLVFVASGWIMVSWLIVIGVTPPIQPTSSAYTPAAEMLVTCMLIGGFIAWPLYRLTVAPRYSVPVRTALEIVSLVGLVLVVLWPLRLVTTWSIARVAWINADIVSTLFLIGGITVFGAKSGLRRTVAMAAILAWIVAPPVLEFLLEAPQAIGLVSPLARIQHLAQGGSGPIDSSVWYGPAISLLAGVVLWIPPLGRGLAHPVDSQ